MSTTPILLALTGSSLEALVVQALQTPSSGPVRVVRRCVDLADLAATAATGRARAALLAADVPHLDTDVVAQLRMHDVEPIGVTAAADHASTHRLHQMGVRVVLEVREDTDLVAGVLDALAGAGGDEPSVAERPGVEGPARAGEVVAVWGPTGAPGRTTVAVGLASELAVLGRATLLVDADAYGGTVAQHLGLLDDVSGVLAAARSARVGALDAAQLAGQARRVGALTVLSGLPRADRWAELSPSVVAAILTAARGLADWVVVDCGFSLETDEELMFDTAAPRRNGATLRVLDQADHVLVVGAADPVGLSRLARGVVDLTTVLPGIRPTLLVNRMRHSLGWSAEEATSLIERFTGRGPAVVLPEDRAACDRALVRGQTLAECAPGSALRSALHDLAAELAGLERRRRGRRTRVRSVS